MADPRLPETDPRLPESQRREAQLPDPLDQVPGDDPTAQRGSEDAQLLAEAEAAEGDVEAGPALEPGQLNAAND